MRIGGRWRAYAERVLPLVGGSVGGQLLTLAAMPVLTRLYSVRHFGQFAAFVAVVNISRKVSCLRYDQAIVASARVGDRGSLFALALLWPVFFALAAFLIGLATGTWYPDDLPLTLIGYGATAILLSGWKNALMNFHNAHGRSRVMGTTLVVELAVAAAVQILVYAATGYRYGLILGNVCGLAVGVGLGLGCVGDRGCFRSLTWAGLRESFVRYRDFPLKTMSGGLFTVLANRAPVLMVSLTHGLAASGVVGLSNRALSAPSALVGQAVGQVFLRECGSGSDRERSMREATLRALRVLAVFGFVPFVAVALFGPELFAFVFGSEWRASGRVAAVLAPMLYLMFVIEPVAHLTWMSGSHGFFLGWSVVRAILVLLALLTGLWHPDLLVPMIALALVQSLALLAMLRWVLRRIGI